MANYNNPLLEQAVNANNYRPEFLRVDDAIKISGIKKTKLYQWMGEGLIRSVSIRDAKTTRGIRLIEYDSLMKFINSFDEGFKQS